MIDILYSDPGLDIFILELKLVPKPVILILGLTTTY